MAVVHITNDNFEAEITKSDVPVIMDFWAEWCGPCQMMGPVFEEISKDYEGKLKFAKVNTEEFPNIATDFAVQGIPSLVVTKEGKEADRLVGFAPKEVLKQRIDAILEKL